VNKWAGFRRFWAADTDGHGRISSSSKSDTDWVCVILENGFERLRKFRQLKHTIFSGILRLRSAVDA
jgi:hypothetical protein